MFERKEMVLFAHWMFINQTVVITFQKYNGQSPGHEVLFRGGSLSGDPKFWWR